MNDFDNPSKWYDVTGPDPSDNVVMLLELCDTDIPVLEAAATCVDGIDWPSLRAYLNLPGGHAVVAIPERFAKELDKIGEQLAKTRKPGDRAHVLICRMDNARCPAWDDMWFLDEVQQHEWDSQPLPRPEAFRQIRRECKALEWHMRNGFFDLAPDKEDPQIF